MIAGFPVQSNALKEGLSLNTSAHLKFLTSSGPVSCLSNHPDYRVAGAVGIEPTTFGFGDRRSAN
jgi:hypothetical protein